MQRSYPSLRVYYRDQALHWVADIRDIPGEGISAPVFPAEDRGLDRALDWVDGGGQGPAWIVDPKPGQWISRLSLRCRVQEAAGGWVLDREGRALWIRRLGRWDLPKGKREEGEDWRETAIREVLEETGVMAEITGSGFRTSHHLYRQGEEIILKITRWYRMVAQGIQDPVPQTEEGIESILWVPPSQWGIYLENTYPNIRYILQTEEPGTKPWVPHFFS